MSSESDIDQIAKELRETREKLRKKYVEEVNRLKKTFKFYRENPIIGLPHGRFDNRCDNPNCFPNIMDVRMDDLDTGWPAGIVELNGTNPSCNSRATMNVKAIHERIRDSFDKLSKSEKEQLKKEYEEDVELEKLAKEQKEESDKIRKMIYEEMKEVGL